MSLPHSNPPARCSSATTSNLSHVKTSLPCHLSQLSSSALAYPSQSITLSVCLSHCSTSSPCVFPHTELMFFKDAFKALCQAMTERGLYPSYKALYITSGTEYTSRCATALHVEAIPLGTTLLAGKHCSPDALQLLQAAKRHLSHQKDAQGRGKGPKQTQTSFFPIQYMSILYFLDRSSLSYLLKRKTKPNKTQIRK